MVLYILGLSLINLVLVFIMAFLDSWGVPGAGIIIIGTAATLESFSSLLLLIFIVYIAISMGDIATYSFARILSTPLLHRLRKFSFFAKGEHKARASLKKYEFLILFTSRFTLSSLCPIVNYIAGIEKISRRKFILAVITGEFLYAIIFSVAGFLFGTTALIILSNISHLILLMVLLLVLIWMIRVFLKIRIARKIKALEEEIGIKAK